MPNLAAGTITAITDQTDAIKSAIDSMATAHAALIAAVEAARVELKGLHIGDQPYPQAHNRAVQLFVQRAGLDAMYCAIADYAAGKGLRPIFQAVDRVPGSSSDVAVTNLSTFVTNLLDPWTA